MRIGISLTSAHQTDDVRAAATWMIERAAAARDAGLDSLFIGDHHSMPAPYYQNTPMLGRLLAEWGDRPAGCLFLLPLWNPVILAEQVGTLASIHKGRFILQCALGTDERQFAAMGVELKKRPSLFEENLDICRRLWAGEVVSSDRRYQITRARIAPRPPEPVEVWIGGSVEPSIDRAARLGDGWLAGPELTPEQARSFSQFYLDRTVAYGRKPAAVAIRRDIYVGSSAADAEAVAGPIVKGGYRGFDASACTYGDVAEVVRQFRTYAEIGYTDIIVRHLTDDQGPVLGSMARLKEVRAALAGV